jgi:hypothetical protein
MMHIAGGVTCRFVATEKRAKDGGPAIEAGPIATQPRDAAWRRCIIDAHIVGAVGGGKPHRPIFAKTGTKATAALPDRHHDTAQDELVSSTFSGRSTHSRHSTFYHANLPSGGRARPTAASPTRRRSDPPPPIIWR